MRLPIAERSTTSDVTGANLGGSDGIDVWGTNCWIHDVEVKIRDECVTVKVCRHISTAISLYPRVVQSPASNIQVERSESTLHISVSLNLKTSQYGATSLEEVP